MNHFRGLYSHTSGRVRENDGLASLFEKTSDVQQRCPVSPLLFNCVTERAMEDVLTSLCSNAKIGWNDRVSDLEVKNAVVCASSENLLPERMKHTGLRWLGRVMHMTNTHLSYRALCCIPSTECSKPCGYQQMT